MKKSFVKSQPRGDFADVSALNKGWESKLLLLVGQKRSIKYDIYPFQKIPQEIENNLIQNGYHDLILENDQWQHFLVPHSN
jgi:hypothetical protein